MIQENTVGPSKTARYPGKLLVGAAMALAVFLPNVRGGPEGFMWGCHRFGLDPIFYLLMPFPFFSTIVLCKNQLFSVGVQKVSRKKDPWKE